MRSRIARVSSHGCLEPHGGARPRRHPAARSRRPAAAGRDRHGAVAARVARGGGRRRGRGRRTRPPAARHRARAARPRRRRSSTGATSRCWSITSGSASYRVHTYAVGGLPPPAGCRDAPAAPGRPRGAARDDRRVSRSASRDESRPVLTGILVRFEPDKLVMAATDSYRLAVKETPAPSRCPSSRRSSRPARCRSSRGIAAAADEVQLGVHENHVVFGAERRLADDPPHRRPVPELPPAAAGAVRARAAAAARGAARRRPPRGADGAAQLAAAAALRRRRADGLGADAGCRRGARVAAGAVQRPTRWRSASTPSSCATASTRSTRRPYASS